MTTTTTMRSHGATAVLLSLLTLNGASATSKMLHEPVTEGKLLGPSVVEDTLVTSNSTIVWGDCAPGAPFSVPLYGPSGHGVIGVRHPDGVTIALKDGATTPNRYAVPIPDREHNFFGIEADVVEDFKGIPFQYLLQEEDQGTHAEVTCTVDTEIVVIVDDDIDFEVAAHIEADADGDEVELLGGVQAKNALQGSTRAKKGKGNSPVSFDPSSSQKIKIKHAKGNSDKGLALVDGIFVLPNGKEVRRTFTRESKLKPSDFKKPRGITVKCCDINDDGDVEITFPGLSKKDEILRVDARLGLRVTGTVLLEVVDVTAMLSEDAVVTVHGGWIRKLVDDMELGWLEDDAFEVSLVDVVVSDPSDGQRIVGVMGNVVSNGVPKGQKNKKKKLTQAPTQDEKEVNEDMKKGKKPASMVSSGGDSNGNGNSKNKKSLRRQLSSNHKKILVHGYCAGGSPWPAGDFTDAVTFVDPETNDPNLLNNWSHDLFARKIRDFANDNNIDSCGIIAHSQGGAASLHLYTYYWSCLDYASEGGSKLIQSLGTPYRGTNLAGSLASLGDIFGVGCGTNSDLTTSGADTWLASIPYSSRGKVTYYRTMYNDGWGLDWCNWAASAMVSDKDDGTTGIQRGILAGGINGGLKEGQCHTSGMRDVAQYNDSSRNSQMNSNAKY